MRRVRHRQVDTQGGHRSSTAVKLSAVCGGGGISDRTGSSLTAEMLLMMAWVSLMGSANGMSELRDGWC